MVWVNGDRGYLLRILRWLGTGRGVVADGALLFGNVSALCI
jgi:hypothetical protein